MQQHPPRQRSVFDPRYIWAMILVTIHGVSSDAPVCEGDPGQCESGILAPCGLYLAPSTKNPETLTLYSGVDRDAHELVGEPDIALPFLDPNKNEWSAWHDMVWNIDVLDGLILENSFLSELLLPGVGTLPACSVFQGENVRLKRNHVIDSLDVHRAKDATAGSFSYHHGVTYETVRSMAAGEELFLDCLGPPPPFRRDKEKDEDDGNDDLDNDVYEDENGGGEDDEIRSLEWLQENGVCVDNIWIGPSTKLGIGNGAFTKRAVAKGTVIAPSPVLHLDRSQLQIVEQRFREDPFPPFFREHGVEYSDYVVGQQLALNYCYGHPDSNVLLLPLAPGINFINHDAISPNAFVRWSTSLTEPSDWLEETAHQLFAESVDGTLLIEFVALREIAAGEEIFIDYGETWSTAWNSHVKEWTFDGASYISAAKFEDLYGNDAIRTHMEQSKNPYPDNLTTACYFVAIEVDDEEELVEWENEALHCLRPCSIKTRYKEDGITFYTAIVYPLKSPAEPQYCGEIPDSGLFVTGIPLQAVKVVDKAYSSDVNQRNTFRHEIGIPKRFYPSNWMSADSRPLGDFSPDPLKPGEMAEIRWASSGDVATKWAYRLGLHESIRKTLLEYCDRMGITDIFRHVTTRDNALLPGADKNLELNGHNWFLQRPDKKWRSNLHWLSPGDNAAHEDYLQALSVSGFDTILRGIGEQMGMDGLVAFHVTFIAVSYSTEGYMHYDVTATGGKAYNIIIPLILANETGPELDLRSSSILGEDETESLVGRYRYEYEVASMLGDDAYHATSAVDYRASKEMRMAATIYVADVNEENAGAILNEYTQAYPPDDRDLLMSWSGRHWRKDDTTAKLPAPVSGHILLEANTDNTS